MQSELSTLKEHLLGEFLPDDVCPLGSQSLMDSPCKIYEIEAKTGEFKDKVTILSIEFFFRNLKLTLFMCICCFKCSSASLTVSVRR